MMGLLFVNLFVFEKSLRIIFGGSSFFFKWAQDLYEAIRQKNYGMPNIRVEK